MKKLEIASDVMYRICRIVGIMTLIVFILPAIALFFSLVTKGTYVTDNILNNPNVTDPLKIIILDLFLILLVLVLIWGIIQIPLDYKKRKVLRKKISDAKSDGFMTYVMDSYQIDRDDFDKFWDIAKIVREHHISQSSFNKIVRSISGIMKYKMSQEDLETFVWSICYTNYFSK